MAEKKKKSDKPAIPPIMARLLKEHGKTGIKSRRRAILELQDLGEDAGEALPELVEILRSGHEDGEAVAEMMLAVGGERALDDLRAILRDPEAKGPALWHTLETLENLRKKAVAATPDLIPLLSSSEDLVRSGVVGVLRYFGSAAAEAAPALIEAFHADLKKGKSLWVAEQVPEVLAHIALGDPRVNALLREVIALGNKRLDDSLASAIMYMRPVNEETRGFLIEMLTGKNKRFWNCSVMALNGNSNPSKADYAALKPLLKSRSSRVRESAEIIWNNWKKREKANC